jgi:hypothetical protein
MYRLNDWCVRLAIVVVVGAGVLPAAPVDAGFTYQGKLVDSGAAVNGAVDMFVGVYDAAEGGTQIGETLHLEDVEIVQGVFHVTLEIPEGTFTGEDRWLEFAVQTPGAGDLFTTLSPRQPVTPAPYAAHAVSAGLADRVNGFYRDDSGTLVIGAAANRQGNVYLEDAIPELCLDSRNDALAAQATIRFLHHGVSKGRITWMSDGEILHLHAGGAGGSNFILNGTNGNTSIGPFIEAQASLQIQTGEDVAPGSVDAYLLLGHTDGANLAFDNNEIMTRTRGEATALYLNHEGGDVLVGGNSDGATHLAVNTNSAGSYTLTVNGSAGKPGGGSWSSFSDIRLKHDIEPLPAGTLDRVLSLRGYSFEYDDEAVEHRLALPGRQIGLIAQEVEEVFPDWVEEDEDGYKFVTERGVMALMVESLRELRTEAAAANAAQNEIIAELKREIEELRKLNAELRDRQAEPARR